MKAAPYGDQVTVMRERGQQMNVFVYAGKDA